MVVNHLRKIPQRNIAFVFITMKMINKIKWDSIDALQ